MTSDNPNNDPPASFPLQRDYLRGFSIGSNEDAGSSVITNNFDGATADHMSVQPTLLSDSSFSYGCTHEPPHSGTLDIPLAGLDSTTTSTAQSKPSGGIVFANNLVDYSTHLNKFYNPQSDRSFISTRDNTARGIHMTRQSGETYDSIHRPQIDKNSAGCGANGPVSHHTPDSRVLAIGRMEAIPEFSVPVREIAHGSERVTPPLLDTSIGQKAVGSSLNPSRDVPSEFSSFQSNSSEFLGLAQNEDGWTSSHNDQKFKTGSHGTTSSPARNLQPKQVDMQHCIPMPSNMSLVLGGSRDARSLSKDAYMGVQDYLAAASRPFSASQGHLSNYGQVRLPALTSESAHTTRITTHQSDEQLQRSLKSYRKFLPDSSLLSPFIGVHKSSIRHDQLGQETPANQSSFTLGAEGAHFPNRVEVQPTSHPCNDFPRSNDVHARIPRWQPFPAGLSNSSQIVEGGLSQRRMELPLAYYGDVSNLQGQVIPAAKGSTRTQAFDVLVGQPQKKISKQNPPVNSDSLRSSVPPNFLGLTSSAGPLIPSAQETEVGQASIARVRSSLKRKVIRPPQAIPLIQRRKSTPLPSTRPLVPTPDQNAPFIKTAPALDKKRQASPVGPFIPPAMETEVGQASGAHVGSSLKRKAIRPPLAIPPVQRRKATPLPPTQPPVPTTNQNALSIKTDPAFYIKRQDSDKHRTLQKSVQTGVECQLCHKDLSYKPEGSVCLGSVSENLPEVAFLPCGHVFHDYCLQLITPQDQSKNPPCIPCAIGEP